MARSSLDLQERLCVRAGECETPHQVTLVKKNVALSGCIRCPVKCTFITGFMTEFGADHFETLITLQTEVRFGILATCNPRVQVFAARFLVFHENSMF